MSDLFNPNSIERSLPGSDGLAVLQDKEMDMNLAVRALNDAMEEN